MALSSETIFALYPLLAFTPPPSGLGLPPTTIGLHMALRSALNIATMCLAAPIQQRIGSVRTFRWGMGCNGAAVLVLWVLVGVHAQEVGVGFSTGIGKGADEVVIPSPGAEEGRLGLTGNFLVAAFLVLWGGGSLVWRELNIFFAVKYAHNMAYLASSQVILVESPASPEDLALVVVSSIAFVSSNVL
jgi:hypothetical protein